MNTDTPETDDADYCIDDYTENVYVCIEFCRKLERERNQAIAKEQDATELCKRMIALAEKLEAERNQARKERDELHDVCNRIAEHVVNDPQMALAELLAMDGILRKALEKLKETKNNNV